MDRFTWLVASAVLALVIGGVAAAALMRAHDPPPDLTTASGVVLAYAQAEQRGDSETAWELLATPVKERTGRERFLTRSHTFDDRGEYLTTENERDNGDLGTVTLVTTYPGSVGLWGRTSLSERQSVRLTREADGWRITEAPDSYLWDPNWKLPSAAAPSAPERTAP
jgi:hypothetical protein